MNANELLMLSVKAADEKKAEDIISINMQGISDIADYFLVCHGNNERQVQAIAKAVKDHAEEQGIHVKRMEGYDEARWILIDLADVVVHVFHKDERDYYNLEKLYHDAEILGYQRGYQSVMAYQTLSAFYDKLTDDQPYDQWRTVIQHFLPSEHVATVLDLGCGTGTLTTSFLDFADHVVGMDLSEEMVTYAQQKSEKVEWLVGNMAAFSLSNRFDVITILCDSLNYLTDEEDVLATLNHVYQHLKNDGVLIFDVHTTQKMDTQFNGATYLDDRENLTLVWQTEPGELPHSVWHDLTFFVQRENGLYERYDESQFQRTLDKPIYHNMLESIGFKKVTSFYDFDPNNDNPTSDRLFFVATK